MNRFFKSLKPNIYVFGDSQKGKVLRTYTIILIAILLVGLFFRTYELVERLGFGHDGDLYSWIVKDIYIDHHPRLIGQLTSAPGIFIGPLFYYLLIPFFLITNMDPIATTIPLTIFAILSLISIYYVFSKLFNPITGLIATFLQAVTITNINFDRWIVPSTPTNLWVIWYFYVCISIVRGNYNVLPVLGVLIGLIWHIHIALIPTLTAIPFAFILSKKLPDIKQSLMFLIALFFTSVPFLAFELKHNFSQTFSLIHNFGIDHGGGTGLDKFNLIFIKFSSNIHNLFFSPQNIPIDHKLIVYALLLSTPFLVWKKLLKVKELIVLFVWIFGVVVFFSISSTLVSEYYFYSLEVIFVLIVSFWFYLLFKSSHIGKVIAITLLLIVLIKNLYFFTTVDYYHAGYLEHKRVAEFITQDSRSKNFPCVSVSYITRPGDNVGFRYFFYLNKLHVNEPKSGSPVYTIVLPFELALSDVEVKFGNIGVITPKNIPSNEKIQDSCSGQNANLTDPMLGFTK